MRLSIRIHISIHLIHPPALVLQLNKRICLHISVKKQVSLPAGAIDSAYFSFLAADSQYLRSISLSYKLKYNNTTHFLFLTHKFIQITTFQAMNLYLQALLQVFYLILLHDLLVLRALIPDITPNLTAKSPDT